MSIDEIIQGMKDIQREAEQKSGIHSDIWKVRVVLYYEDGIGFRMWLQAHHKLDERKANFKDKAEIKEDFLGTNNVSGAIAMMRRRIQRYKGKSIEERERAEAKKLASKVIDVRTRDVDADFETLKKMFNRTGELGYGELIEEFKDAFHQSKATAHDYYTFWKKKKMIVKTGVKNSRYGGYILGEQPL